MDNILEYFKTQKKLFPDLVNLFDTLEGLLLKQLYYQYSLKLLEVIKTPFFLESKALLDFYNNAVEPLGEFLDSFIFAKFVRCVTDYIDSRKEKSDFLVNTIKSFDVLKNNPKSTFLISLKIFETNQDIQKPNENDTHLLILRQTFSRFRNFGDFEYSEFYAAEMNLYKKRGENTLFFNSAMNFMKHVKLDELRDEDKLILMEDVCASAVVNNIYSLGNLIMNPLFNKLKQTCLEDMMNLVVSVEKGDLTETDRLISKISIDKKYGPFTIQYKQRILQKSREIMFLKICGECAMQRNNVVRMDKVEMKCSLTNHATELLIIDMICAELVKGKIDQVRNVFILEEIKPRILYGGSINLLQSCTKNWVETIERND